MVGRSNFYLNFIKRPFDFVVALLGLLFLSPIFLVLIVCIRFIEGPPVFFIQERVGLGGKTFNVVKFRTMRTSMNSVTTITVSGDFRITKTGAFLRRYKLDELPQLWNVVKGEMSLVGPRPDVPGYMDNLKGQSRKILRLRPGITGPATLAFRNEEDILAKVSDPKTYNDQVIFPEKVRLNLGYMEEASLFYDINLILKTLLPKRPLL